eukprot:CAMPEP_0170576200 /NCGR_PEP_ID=MMETSP0224-20130122/4264_1 /TAXON_ID=285029 /ORGANISM="Togula jolla, Strain CCCM 725" /LENGTH=437 /DNA_ID=CAMNT_0010899023 /DNA_START=114 /DNA_END=1423 /DNA_ORIENTATION=+
MTVALDLIAAGFTELWKWLSPIYPDFAYWPLWHLSFGLTYLLGGGIFGAKVLLYIARARRFSTEMPSPTHLFYRSLLFYCTSTGLVDLNRGVMFMVYPIPGGYSSWANLLWDGSVMLIPAVAIAALGSRRISNFLARRFDKDTRRAQLDGAFFAELLNALPIHVGQTWWLHHGRNKSCYPVGDRRRNWQCHTVVKVQEQHFAVDARAGRYRPGSQASLLWLPLPGSGESAAELLGEAKRQLRCIEWGKITADLMRGSVLGSEASDLSQMYEMSRPLQAGETIDFFLSHSWYDDGDVKMQKLKALVESFRNRKGREPTFWIDKVCVDQSRIADCLKVLPVNVMACSQLLVLFGKTYPDRLWCAWELYILFAFAREEHAAERLVLLPLDSTSSAIAQLSNFDEAQAHCYDPNEERRLRQVIRAVSTREFNRRIRACAST